MVRDLGVAENWFLRHTITLGVKINVQLLKALTQLAISGTTDVLCRPKI